MGLLIQELHRAGIYDAPLHQCSPGSLESSIQAGIFVRHQVYSFHSRPCCVNIAANMHQEHTHTEMRKGASYRQTQSGMTGIGTCLTSRSSHGMLRTRERLSESNHVGCRPLSA